MHSGKAGSLRGSKTLISQLKRGGLTIFETTTFENYRESEYKNSLLERSTNANYDSRIGVMPSNYIPIVGDAFDALLAISRLIR